MASRISGKMKKAGEGHEGQTKARALTVHKFLWLFLKLFGVFV